MVVSCSACGEQYGVNEDVTFHKFPADEQRRKEWLKVVQRKAWIPGKRSMLCSKHFLPDKFVYKISGDKISRHLMPDTIPTIFGGCKRNEVPEQLDENNKALPLNLNVRIDAQTVESRFLNPGAGNVADNSTSSLNLQILPEISDMLQIAADPGLIQLQKDTASFNSEVFEIPGAASISVAGTSSNNSEIKLQNREMKDVNFPKAMKRNFPGKDTQPDVSSIPKRIRQVYPGDFKQLNYNDTVEVSRSWTVLNNYIKKMRSNVKVLQQRNRRLEKRVMDLKSVVKFLKNRLVERDSAAVRLCGRSDLPGATLAAYRRDTLRRETSNPLQDHNYISTKDK